MRTLVLPGQSCKSTFHFMKSRICSTLPSAPFLSISFSEKMSADLRCVSVDSVDSALATPSVLRVCALLGCETEQHIWITVPCRCSVIANQKIRNYFAKVALLSFLGVCLFASRSSI